MNTKVWKFLKKLSKNRSHEMCNRCYQNEKHSIMGRVNTKTIRPVRRVCVTIMTSGSAGQS